MPPHVPPDHALITADESVLVVIDVQEKLMPVIADKQQVADNIVRLTAFAEIVGLPVIVTEQQKLGPTLAVIARQLPGLSPLSKIHFNCFCNDEFKERIHHLSRRVILLAGVEAHICVAQTALYGLKDHSVHVITDAISSRSPHNRQTAIGRMLQAGVTITSTEMLIYELLQKAGTDIFKSTLPLIK